MTTPDLEQLRIDKLENAIRRFNEEIDPKRVLAADFTSMFEVLHCRKRQAVLFDLDMDEKLEPVYLPDRVAMHIKKGDVFLMTLIPVKSGWEPIFISNPYEEVLIDCDVENGEFVLH